MRVGRLLLDALPVVDQLGQRVLVAQRPGRVAHRRAGAVGDDVRHLGAVVAPVALVDVLDDLLAAPALDVHVDVGGAVARRGQEPLEQQVQRDGVHVGDAEGVTHRRVGGRAAPLAEDPGPAAELHDVPHHEEVAAEPQRLDDVELAVELRPGPGDPLGAAGPVAAGAAVCDEAAQVARLVETVGAGVGRQGGGQQLQIEGALAPQLGGSLHDPRPAGEAGRLLGAGAQVSAGRRQPAVDLVQAAACPQRGQRRGQPLAVHRVVVHVAGGDERQVGAGGQLGEGLVAHRVARQPVVPQFDGHIGGTEVGGEPLQRPAGCGHTPVRQGPRHRPLAAAGEDQPVVTGARPAEGDEVLVVDPGRILGPCQLALADGPRQQRVAAGIAGQHQQVHAFGVGHPGALPVPPAAPSGLRRGGRLRGQGELGTEDGREPEGPGRLGEAHHAVEAVVIADGQRLEPQPDRLGGQLLGMGGPVQEGEVGVAVQFRVADRRLPTDQILRRPVRPALARPGRAVVPVAGPDVDGASAVGPVRGRPVREQALDVAPRHVGIVPAHSPTVYEYMFVYQCVSRT